MYISLADRNLVKYYRMIFAPDEEAPQLIVSLLEKLSEKPYAEKLSAVTSHGQLSLTTALSRDDKSHNYSVKIDHIIDAAKPVLVISGTAKSRKEPVAWRYCSLDEADEYIDLYVMRILLEKNGEL